MFTYSGSTTDSFRNRALVLDFFAQDDDGTCPEQLATHAAMKLDDEEFEDAADVLYREGLLARDSWSEYGITSRGAQAHATAQGVIDRLEAEVSHQAFGERVAA